MHRIIGGEFLIDSKLLSKNKKSIEIQYSSGRSALYSILVHKKGTQKKLLLPAYLCDSITRTVIDVGWEFDFYQLDEFMHPRIDQKLCSKIEEFDAILLINYFGMVDLRNDIERIRKERKDIFIIEDDVQAFYTMNDSMADCSFTSLRKWFPCPDGAMIYMKDSVQIEPCIKMENEWSQYKLAGGLLKEQSDYIDDSIMLSLLNKGEDILDNGYLSPCSKASKKIIANLDLEKIAHQRTQNAKMLHRELEKLGVKHLYSDYGVPLVIPIFIEKREELRNAYFSEQIFTPKHWPKIDNLCGDSWLYDQELSLICDQRYGIEDMKRQIEVLKAFIYSKGY